MQVCLGCDNGSTFWCGAFALMLVSILVGVCSLGDEWVKRRFCFVFVLIEQFRRTQQIFSKILARSDVVEYILLALQLSDGGVSIRVSPFRYFVQR